MIIKIKQRMVFFIAVEGDSERSFIKWIQELCDSYGLHVHLDCVSLNGGGYKAMLDQAIAERKKRESRKSKAAYSILIVDSDRAMLGDDPWTQDKLREESLKYNMTTYFQNPNLEGILLRMFPSKANIKPNARDAKKLLAVVWSDYKKGADAQMLRSKFTLNDLLCAAKMDDELNVFLQTIGLVDP